LSISNNVHASACAKNLIALTLFLVKYKYHTGAWYTGTVGYHSGTVFQFSGLGTDIYLSRYLDQETAK